MKDKIIMFITGLLVGAIIATGIIYFYISSTANNFDANFEDFQAEFKTPPNMPNGQDFNDNEGQRPEKPNENDMQRKNQANNNKEVI